MKKTLNEQPNNAIENKKPKETYKNPLLLALGDVSEKATTLKNNDEIINYLVDEVPEDELKKYILYFLSKTEKVEIPKHDRESCIEFLSKKSEEGKNIYIDNGGNYYYSLGFESENDYSLMSGWNNRRCYEPRVDVLIYKIKGKKGIKESLKSIPNIIEEGKKYITNKQLYENFERVINIIKKELDDGKYEGVLSLFRQKKGLEFLKKVKEGERWKNIKNEIINPDCLGVLAFLITYLEEGECIEDEETYILLECAKMEYDLYNKNHPGIEIQLKDLGLKEDATLEDVAEKLHQKALGDTYRYIIEYNGKIIATNNRAENTKDYFIKQYYGELDMKKELKRFISLYKKSDYK